MRLFERLTHLATTLRCGRSRGAASSSPLPRPRRPRSSSRRETATVRAGKWVVTSDSTASGGGRRCVIRTPGAAKITTARWPAPPNYFELTFSCDRRRALPPLALRQGRQATTGATTRSSCSSRAASPPPARRPGASAPPRRPKSTSRNATAAASPAGSGRTTAGAGSPRPADLLRDDRHPAHARPDARRRPLDRSDRVDSRSASPRLADARPRRPVGRDASRCSTGIRITASAPTALQHRRGSSPGS